MLRFAFCSRIEKFSTAKEFPTDRAKNCKDYFNKLIEIARNKVSFDSQR